MTEHDAKQIHTGDIVLYKNRRARVNSVRIKGIAAPYFRLSDHETGHGIEDGQLISYRLCGIQNAPDCPMCNDTRFVPGDLGEARCPECNGVK